MSLAQLAKVEIREGAYDIFREGNSRYVGVRYEVRGRDLGTTVRQAIDKVTRQVKLPRGYHLDWAGEYESEKRAQARLFLVVPITIFLIFVLLYFMFRSVKWASLIMVNVALAPFGGTLALLMTGTFFSVSSGVGFLALFGVSVQTGVIMLEYINQLLARGYTIEGAAVEGAVLRLRPIMMSMLVATDGPTVKGMTFIPHPGRLLLWALSICAQPIGRVLRGSHSSCDRIELWRGTDGATRQTERREEEAEG